MLDEQLIDLIWPIAQLVLEGMSREQALAHVANEHGIDPLELKQRLL